MAIHCYGEEVKDVNIVNDPLEVNSNTKIQGSVDVNGSVNIGSAGGERIPVDVSINNQLAHRTGEDDLVLSIALQLYSNSNFDSIKNLSKHAGLCLERANTFSEVYAKFKSKEAIVDSSRVTDVKLYVQYKPGDSYVDITIVDVSERFMHELSEAGAFLLGFESYNKFGHASRQRRKYKILNDSAIEFNPSNLNESEDIFIVNDSYIIFSATSFYGFVLNKTFSIKIQNVWDTRAFSGLRDYIKRSGESWDYKPIQIRPTFRSCRSGWQQANLNIINYKWLIFQYPYK